LLGHSSRYTGVLLCLFNAFSTVVIFPLLVVTKGDSASVPLSQLWMFEYYWEGVYLATGLTAAMAERKKTILIADDEPKVADTLRMILENAGYRTLVAHNGEDAARLISKSAPDAVLLDVILPAMDGVEVAIQACQAAPNCKVLLFSGQPDATELLAQASSRGYRFEILAKPARPKELLQRIGELLAR